MNPTCSCFYESVRLHGDDGQSFAGCDACDDATPCADDTLTCSYGFCEESDEPIGLRRLEARPTATLSLEAQERHERMERTHRDD